MYIELYQEKTNNKTNAVIHQTKRSLIVEHLFNNVNCATNYDLLRFNAINNGTNSLDLLKLEAISIFKNNPELCKQKELDYKLSLFVQE